MAGVGGVAVWKVMSNPDGVDTTVLRSNVSPAQSVGVSVRIRVGVLLAGTVTVTGLEKATEQKPLFGTETEVRMNSVVSLITKGATLPSKTLTPV